MKKLAALLVVPTTLATQAAAQCDTAENVLATSVTATTVNISFTSPSVHLYYVVKYNGLRQNVNDPGGPYPALISSPLSGLTPSTLYTFSIVAYCSPTDSSTGSNYTFTTPAAACDTVTNVVTSVTNSTATITSTEAVYGTSYTVYYVKNGFTDTATQTGTDADFYLEGLRYNTTYKFRIKSFCASGNTTTAYKSFTTANSVNYTSMSGFGANWKRTANDSTQNIPTGTVPSLRSGANNRAAIFYDSSGHTFFWFDPQMQAWHSDNYVDIKWFGAVGNGVASVSQDTKALKDALNYLRTIDGKRALFISPPKGNFYAYVGNGELVPSNIEIFGVGPKSEIRNVNPDSAATYRGVIFYTGTYGPSVVNSIFLEPTYNIHDAAEGDTSVILDTPGYADSLDINDVIILASHVYYKNGDTNQPRYAYIEQNKITDIRGDTIFFKYPLSTTLPTVGAESPKIVHINSGKTNSAVVPGYVNQTTTNISIHDLTLSQAQINEIDSVPLTGGTPNSTFQLGGTFESRFFNLYLNQYAGLSGNLFGRCEFSNIVLNAKRHMIDVGYGSNNTNISDIYMNYSNNKAADVEVSLIYMNEASHDINVNNIYASGNWRGNNIILIQGGANDININNAYLNFPVLRNTNFAIAISDDEATVYSRNITLKNIYIKADSVGQYLRVIANNSAPGSRNYTLDNVMVDAKAGTTYGQKVLIQNVDNIRLNNIKIPNADSITLSGLTFATVDNFYAPGAYVTTTNTSTTNGLTLLNMQVRESDVSTVRLNGVYSKIYGSSASVYTGIDSRK